MENIGQFLTWFFLLGCALPIVVLFVIGFVAVWFGRRWIADFVEPDTEQLHKEYEALKISLNTEDKRVLVKHVVNKQAWRCGIVGAVTGLGGFITMPIALPLDLLLSARYQASMVSFIAQIYGFEKSLENRAATYAVMTGSTELVSMSTGLVSRYIPRILSAGISKLVPVLSAVIGFVVNYAIAHSMARLAVKWYETKSKSEFLKAI